MRICIITTGGTIGSAGTPLAPMRADEFAAAAERLLAPALAAAMPDLSLNFDRGLRFDSASGMLDSTDLRPGDWCLMARHVLQLYEQFDGFVILHGTDSMDFTAAALPLLLGVVEPLGLGRAVLSKPVILTGAQLPLFRDTPQGMVLNAGSDAFANLAGALACARLHLPEVALFFDGRLWRGNRALKTSTSRFDAFDSPHLPPLAEVGIGAWHGPAARLPGPAAPHLALDRPDAQALTLSQLDAIEAALPSNPVTVIPVFPADPRADAPQIARMVDDAVAAGSKGIVIEGYGEGNVPAGTGAMLDALLRADQAGVVVVICSRVIGGQVGTFHYAAGAWIATTGAVGGLDLTPVAAFAKLTVLLAAAAHHGWAIHTVKSLMQCSLAGECRAADRLNDGDTLLPGQSLTVDGASLTNDPDAGPELRNDAGKVIWSAGGPGRLQMRNGPRLIGFDGAGLWRGPTLDGAIMILTGGKNPSLHLHDPARKAAPVTVFAG